MNSTTHWINPLQLLEQRCQEGWLLNPDHQEFWAIAQSLQHEFSHHQRAGQPIQSILLAESDPLRFLAGFFAAHGTVSRVFLGNAQWGATEWQQAVAIAQPDYVWGDRAPMVCGIEGGEWESGEWESGEWDGGEWESGEWDGGEWDGGEWDGGEWDSGGEQLFQAVRSRSQTERTQTERTQTERTQTERTQTERTQTESLILIPTGGSSGNIRFVMHRWDTLAAAVTGFQQSFQMEAIHSICVLPLYHVSGLMQAVRSLLSGGHLWLTPFKFLKQGHVPPVDPQDWCISLVPTQLQALLQQPQLTQWLSQCRTVFIGGAAPWPDLLQQARAHQIPLSLCYGMTETAAQFTALKPQAFLAGQQHVGQTFPHAQVLVMDEGVGFEGGGVGGGEDELARSLPPHTIGQIYVAADSLALGYYPTGWSSDQIITTPSGTVLFRTDDGGYLDEQGHLTLVGRLSDKIITGGENVFPAEVEAAIWATGLVADVAVVGIPDAYWGQCIAAVYVPANSAKAAPTSQALAAALHPQIARYKHPKVWVPVDTLPRNGQGKVNRQRLEAICGLQDNQY